MLKVQDRLLFHDADVDIFLVFFSSKFLPVCIIIINHGILDDSEQCFYPDE